MAVSVFIIAVNDVDEFDVSTPINVNVAANSVDENATNGTSVGVTVTATDFDNTTNAVTYSLFDDAGGRFAIETTTGIVSVADGSLLDRESAASHSITVRATSEDGSTADSVFFIAVNDVDEFDVSTPLDVNININSADENAANGTSVGVTVTATDFDNTTNDVTYSLFDDAGGRFTIDTTTGIVSVANGSLLDRESAASHSITVRAMSEDGSTAASVFMIAVNDVDEFDVTTPMDVDAAANSVAENSPVGSTIGIAAFADDADGTDTVTYSLDESAGGRFSIDANSGLVTVAGAIDREADSSHSITIRASSTDGTAATRTFTIGVSDVDEFDIHERQSGSGSDNWLAIRKAAQHQWIRNSRRPSSNPLFKRARYDRLLLTLGAHPEWFRSQSLIAKAADLSLSARPTAVAGGCECTTRR